VRDRLLAQAKELQTGNILMWGCFGTLTKEQTMRSYELLGREVVPALAAFSPASELAA
jgi:hypothetical protein